MALMFVFNFEKYFRFSVGGMTDVAEIKGHRFVWNTFFSFWSIQFFLVVNMSKYFQNKPLD